MINLLRYINSKLHIGYQKSRTFTTVGSKCLQTAQAQQIGNVESDDKIKATLETRSNVPRPTDILPSARPIPIPMVLNKDRIVLSFDQVPGPKALKYFSSFRHYLSELGTELTAGFLTVGLSIGSVVNAKKSMRNLSVLFDEYGPVVRFVSLVGDDIVLLNHPDHIQKVFTLEGDTPVRSSLDSLEKYRKEHRHHLYAGLYTINGEEWSRQRSIVDTPLNASIEKQVSNISDVCESFAQRIYNIRNYQDEIPKDLYKEVHKWAFDCLGQIIFSKRFTMIETELVYSQCDMSWLYHSLEQASEAIMKCESGMRFWKLFTTPAWHSLIKYCDNLDNLIGKHVLEAEQALAFNNQDDEKVVNVITSMLTAEEKMSVEDIATVVMDMLIIGVNTISSSSSFLLYHLAKYQRAQNKLYHELNKTAFGQENLHDINKLKSETPYLQACIKETLRLVPPIPVLTRILPKNITLDRYNIPRGTVIIMSTQDASLKEFSYEEATKFMPERWLKPDAKDYHAFASIPFGFGPRKCLGQNMAETMMTLLVIKVLQKYKLEYHYGDVSTTRSFITKPNRPLKIRFIDRY